MMYLCSSVKSFFGISNSNVIFAHVQNTPGVVLMFGSPRLPRWLEPIWLEPIWLEPFWQEPFWLELIRLELICC